MMDKIEYKKNLIEVGTRILGDVIATDPKSEILPELIARRAFNIADDFLKKVEDHYPN